MMRRHHTIEIFSANCPLCKHVIDNIEIGKCEGCNQTVYNVNIITDKIKSKIRDYGIKAVPSIIIDGKIKLVGIPDFPWICSEDLYDKLKKEYPLNS
jgi:glutaredoxin 3